MDNKENQGLLNINSTFYQTRLSRKFLERKPFRQTEPGLVVCFIPGTIIDILVHDGQQVRRGDEILVLDAMKMQNRLKSLVDGKIKKINVKKGDKVAKGAILVEIE